MHDISGSLKIVLPFPPSVNAYWKQITLKTRGGKTYRSTGLTKKARLFRTAAIIAIKKQHPGHAIIDYHVKVRIRLYPPTLRKFDVDNFNKGILDALTHAKIWVDDELVYDLHIIKDEKIKGGKAVVDVIRL